jgi:hypothetical protein
MSDIEKIIDSVNLPKQLIDIAEKFLKKLLGPAVTESGELIADQIRFRRFKNQVVIFNKAKALLESKSIEPKQINLKTLSPLLEYSSLEEEDNIQNIWANVIANISSFDTEQALNLKCIEILKEITPNEIILIDFLFTKFESDEKITLEKWKKTEWLKDRTKVYPDNSIFMPGDFKDELKMTQDQINLYVERLISYGIIKNENPDLYESKEEVGIDYHQTIEIKSYEIQTSERVHFTNFGLYFVRICKFEN